jgi:DNA-binding winged helix-turn-helix (wHTH) protein
MQQTEYVIDDLVRFIPAQGLLCLVDSSETSVPLSPACNHLLEMFLKSAGVVLSREQILDNFWQETGATPSSNSLNAYVSAIRRGLSSLGIEQEAITTVYKVGFVFNPAIRIQKSAPPAPKFRGRTGAHFHIRHATQLARLLAVWRFYLAVTRRASSSATSESEKHHARQRRPA